MKRICSSCKSYMSLHWDYAKCSSCYKASGEWSEDEYWEHIKIFGYKIQRESYGLDYHKDRSYRKRDDKHSSQMFIPPVWY